MAYRLRPEARADLRDIAAHISEDDPRAARRWTLRMRGRFRAIARLPGMGAPRFELRDGLRLVLVGSYNVFHREDGRGVEIVRVIHAARDWESLVQPRPLHPRTPPL